MLLKFKRRFKFYDAEIDTEVLCADSGGYAQLSGDFNWIINPKYKPYFEALGLKGPGEAVIEIRGDDLYIRDSAGGWHHAKFLGSDRGGYLSPEFSVNGSWDEFHLCVINGTVVGHSASAWNRRFLDHVDRGIVMRDVDNLDRGVVEPTGFPPLPIKRLESTVQSGFKAFSAEATKTTEAALVQNDEDDTNNEEGAMGDTEDDDDCGCCPCCGCSCDTDEDEEED